jgi:hypothetical protein
MFNRINQVLFSDSLTTDNFPASNLVFFIGEVTAKYLGIKYL